MCHILNLEIKWTKLHTTLFIWVISVQQVAYVDQIEVFMILNGYENIYRNFFALNKYGRARGHEATLVKDQCRLEQIIYRLCKC